MATVIILPRKLTSEEREVILWLLENASLSANSKKYADTLDEIRVVAKCECGCSTVDFVADAPSLGAKVVADAMGELSNGKVGVMLWGNEQQLTSLETYELDASPALLPPSHTLTKFETKTSSP
jgi:hypothetical protein